VGYHLVKTDNAKNLLSKENFAKLQDLKGEGTVPLWWSEERVVTVSLLRQVKDEFGRRGTWNHTILIPALDYVAATDPVSLLEQYFMEPTDKPPRTLKPLKVEKNNE